MARNAENDMHHACYLEVSVVFWLSSGQFENFNCIASHCLGRSGTGHEDPTISFIFLGFYACFRVAVKRISLFEPILGSY